MPLVRAAIIQPAQIRQLQGSYEQPEDAGND